MSWLAIYLIVHLVLAILSWGIMNGHTHDDVIFDGMRIVMFIVSFLVPYIMASVAGIHCWFYGFKFRLQP